MSDSSCTEYFGFAEFDPERIGAARPEVCPLHGCATPLASVPFRAAEKPYCPTHGIRLHSATFVYWNGADRRDEARLRNFVIRSDLARAIALSSTQKAESHRLGYEMS